MKGALSTSFLSVLTIAVIFPDVAFSRNETNIVQKKPRFLSLFTVAKFANTECTAVGEDGEVTGTCYDYRSCLSGSEDAVPSGSCAWGFGECCTTRLRCGGRSANNNTWLRSPGYPATFNHHLTCEQTVAIDDSICQLRLDIVTLRLAYPDNTGNCKNDYLIVSHDNKFDKLCGYTTDTHFYLDVDSSLSKEVVFAFKTSTFSADRSWYIKVAKIKCNSATEVPRGCGQFYTGTSGTMKGFNQDGSTSENYLLSGLDYGICVRTERSSCSITYQEKGSSNWVPQCGDYFERPGLTKYPTAEDVCKTGAPVGSSPVAAYVVNFLAPHIFLLDTTQDVTNTHLAGTGDFQGGYSISYVQNPC
ncbi:uncharacterized protein LOC135218564 [Macrobrachium nipponense]|uniref:uncharacterized protein LOC135218564 n=1 Tax=Macrobrachium nipponense TaxID=159736 RepID=UPI0030C8B363